MAEIIATKSGIRIHGSDAFLVLKEVMEWRIELPKLSSPSKTEIGTGKAKTAQPIKPITITVAPPRVKRPTKAPETPEVEVPVGSWFNELESLTKNKNKEV